MGAFGVVEPQRSRHGVQNRLGDVAQPTLFQADVVVGAHPGQLRQLLPAQPGDAAAATEDRQASVLGAQSRATGAQELAQLGSGVGHGVHSYQAAGAEPGAASPGKPDRWIDAKPGLDPHGQADRGGEMIGTIVATAAGIVAAPVIAGLGYRAARRYRVARATAIRTPNGIVEERFVRIGGIEQWIGIRGEDRDNPVLLVLHGGPGSPYSVFTPLLRSWEKHFTVVQWDRRGVGRTLGRNGKAGSGQMTFDRMVDDGIEVAEFLRGHLRKEKMILLAGSMGTLVGLPLVQRRPDLFSAYVGTDCYVDMARNEALGYQMALDRIRRTGNAKAVAALEKIGPDPSRWDARAWGREDAVDDENGPGHPERGDETDIQTRSDLADAHPARRRSLVRRLRLRQEPAVRPVHDLRRPPAGHPFPSAVLHLSGRQRRGNPDRARREYFAEVQAPTKGLVRIHNASHFCAFTQPEQFLTGLLTDVRPLAFPPTAPSAQHSPSHCSE